MILLILALTFAALLWILWTQGPLRRTWTGETARWLERDLDFKTEKDKLSFSIPSYKTGYFEVRPLTPWFRLLAKIKFLAPSPATQTIEQQFRFLTEDPRLAEILLINPDILESLKGLQEFGQFRVVSTGQELHGWIKIKAKIEGDVFESEDFQKLRAVLAPLVEVQFDLPLNEMKPGAIRGWKRASVLPFPMLGAGLLLLIIRPQFITQDLILEPRAFKIWLGLSLFATGLGLLWGALRVPPHYFLRVALSYILLFSWSSFFWLHGMFTTVNRIFAADRLSIQCVLDPQGSAGRRKCSDLSGRLHFQIPTEQIPKDQNSDYKFDAQIGWLGQVFLVGTYPEPTDHSTAADSVDPATLSTEAPIEALSSHQAPPVELDPENPYAGAEQMDPMAIEDAHEMPMDEIGDDSLLPTATVPEGAIDDME